LLRIKKKIIKTTYIQFKYYNYEIDDERVHKHYEKNGNSREKFDKWEYDKYKDDVDKV